MPPALPSRHFDQEYDQAAAILGDAIERYLCGEASAAHLLSTADMAAHYGVGIRDAAHQLDKGNYDRLIRNSHGSRFWRRWI